MPKVKALKNLSIRIGKSSYKFKRDEYIEIPKELIDQFTDAGYIKEPTVKKKPKPKPYQVTQFKEEQNKEEQHKIEQEEVSYNERRTINNDTET